VLSRRPKAREECVFNLSWNRFSWVDEEGGGSFKATWSWTVGLAVKGLWEEAAARRLMGTSVRRNGIFLSVVEVLEVKCTLQVRSWRQVCVCAGVGD